MNFTLQLAPRGDREIVMRRTFGASPALVWRAFTEPELVSRWLTGPEGHSMVTCEIDLRVGGAWRYVWDLGDGTRMEAWGSYRELERPRLIKHTETFDMAPDHESICATELVAREGYTEMVMTIDYGTRDVRDAMLGTPMAEGFGASCDRLDGLLEEGA